MAELHVIGALRNKRAELAGTLRQLEQQWETWRMNMASRVNRTQLPARLVRLDLPEVRRGFYPLQAIYRPDSPPGPAAAWMIERFVSQAG
jgi:hypothetical protein